MNNLLRRYTKITSQDLVDTGNELLLCESSFSLPFEELIEMMHLTHFGDIFLLG